ncbi:inactive dipeptidyl peptidase 10 [Chrysoperla carnea]|uniref:inactive dipeptidyl peptidase 10 n=1 Tax=Chrysoperla carnea TaxID=189513 RepID=UPI001D070145|nr:inactive dipeptidyl peptidase 10 [Chrysoperla carnea]
MHANVHADRNSWRLPPDETLQVADPKAKKAEVGDEEDLASVAEDGHNWLSIVFSLLVIAVVIAGIVTAIYLLGYVDELLYWSGRRMKLDEYLQGELNVERLPPAWISHTHFVFQADDGGLAYLDTSNNNITQLVSNHTLRQLNVRGYQCSFDRQYVLFKHNVKTVFRHSFTAQYTVYDVKNDQNIPLRLKDSPKVQPQRLQLASWLGNTSALVIVADNDIYLRTSPSIDDEYRLTFTGKPDVIYNGIPDWLYQEDVFSSSQALWGSQDGTHIMFATFNDSDVGTLTYPWFATGPVITTSTGFGRRDNFPAAKTVRYPTPGTTNPVVQLWIIDVTNVTDPQRWEVKPPVALTGQDYYLTSANWINENNHAVAAVWMNRAQNLSIVSLCQAPNWTCTEAHDERAVEDSWLDIQPHPVFSPDGDSFLLLAAIQEGNTDYYTHIKHVTLTQQRLTVLSHGRYEVIKILEWDTYNNLVYYLGTVDHRPGQQHLYVVRDPTTDDPRRFEPKCITCDFKDSWTNRNLYSNCTHFDAAVSPSRTTTVVEGGIIMGGSSYYVLQCLGPGLPLAAVHSVETHRLLKILYDSRNKRDLPLYQLALPTHRSMEVPLPQGYKAHVRLYLPPSWREELRDAAFPVLVEVNGRPGSRSVSEKFNIDWGTYMSSHNDVVYVKLDVRGARGFGGKKQLFRKLGGVEVQDQIYVLRYLLETEKYLDETRIGVWGWGYGGYVTAMIMGSQQQVFKCGVSVSPITDWLYYNSAFTERIMGLPAENYKGYVEADATQRAKHIPSHSLFVLHGMADVTAPYTHGIELTRALAEAGVIYRYQSYADEGHELVGVLEHVYRSMENYLQECLSLDIDDPRPAPPGSV